MDWNDLRYVAAVSSTGSTLAAAQQLRVSQPTVARRITALEASLGLSLFERHASGYRLTKTGAALLPAIVDVEKAVGAVALAAERQRRRLSGTIRLSAPSVVVELYVAPALTRFRSLYPELQVEILSADRPVDLERGEADVAIQVGARPTEGRLVARRLATDPLALICGRGYAEAKGCRAQLAN